MTTSRPVQQACRAPAGLVPAALFAVMQVAIAGVTALPTALSLFLDLRLPVYISVGVAAALAEASFPICPGALTWTSAHPRQR